LGFDELQPFVGIALACSFRWQARVQASRHESDGKPAPTPRQALASGLRVFILISRSPCSSAQRPVLIDDGKRTSSLHFDLKIILLIRAATGSDRHPKKPCK